MRNPNRLEPPIPEDLLKPLQLTFAKRVAVGSGHVLNDLVGGLWFSYLLIYFQNVIKISPASAGYLMLLGQAADAIITPLIGYEADRPFFLCVNYGRCKAWHLVGVVFVAISTPFVFMSCPGCGNADDFPKLVYFSPFIVLCQIGWASNQIAHLALIPKVSPDELVRTEILAIRYAFTVMSNITVFILAYLILGVKETVEPEDSMKFTEICLLSIGIGIIATVVFHLTVTESSDSTVKRSVAFLNSLPSVDTRRMSIAESLQCSTTGTNPAFNYRRRRSTIGKYSEEARQALLHRNSIAHQPIPDTEISYHLQSGTHYGSIMSNAHPITHSNTVLGKLQSSVQVINHSVQTMRPTNPLSTTWLSLGQDKMTVKEWLMMFQFYVVGIIYMLTRINVNVTQVYLPLYLHTTLGLSMDFLSTVPLAMYVSGLVVTSFIKHLNKYVGRQLSLGLGAIPCIVGAFLVEFLDLNADYYTKTYMVFIIAVLFGAGGTAMLVTSLSICADLIGSNVDSGAFVYGAMSFNDKLSCGIVIGLISFMAPCQIPGEACDKYAEGVFYRDSLAIVSGGTAILGIAGVIILTIKIYLNNRGRFI